MTQEQRAFYGKTVWAEVRKRRGNDFPDCMSSAEWAFLCWLMDADIPLAIVLRGIEDTREVKSLLYAKPAIESAVTRWRKAQYA